MDSSALASAIRDRCLLRGSFLLRSGQQATEYFDKYLFEADPGLLRAVANHLSGLVPAGTQVLAGLELGGVPVATALSLTTGLPAAFVRKEAKAYGTAKLAEGATVDGRNVLVVEDVITTGGQVALSVSDLRARGAVVTKVLCVIDRSGGSVPVLDDAQVEVRSLFTAVGDRLTPTPIFHIAFEADWDAAQVAGHYRTSTRGRSLDEVGFVHCSTRSQVPATGRLFYDDVTEPLVVLEIDPTALGSEVRYEPATPGGDTTFPHVYGPIPTAAVRTVHQIGSKPDRWDRVLRVG